MGFKVNGTDKGRISEINVVPLVDVMLVLLIIFMVTAPLMFNGIQLTLPKTNKVHHLNLTKEQVILSISKTGEVFIGEDKILLTEVAQEVNALFKKRGVDTVFVRADYKLEYGKVAALMTYLKREGIEKISLVTEVEES